LTNPIKGVRAYISLFQRWEENNGYMKTLIRGVFYAIVLASVITCLTISLLILFKGQITLYENNMLVLIFEVIIAGLALLYLILNYKRFLIADGSVRGAYG